MGRKRNEVCAGVSKELVLAVAERNLHSGAVIVGLTGLYILWARHNAVSRFALTSIVNPYEVSSLASEIEGTNEREFVVNSWKWVVDHVAYLDRGSIITIKGEYIYCRDSCPTPIAVISQQRANCFGSSSLLASILRSRIPADRLYMTLGKLAEDGVGGHAWVSYLGEEEQWYVIESTVRRFPDNPWVSYQLVENKYLPEVFFNDQEVICLPGTELCIKLEHCQECQ